MDSLYEKQLLTEEEMAWWRDFFEHQDKTDWKNMGGKETFNDICMYPA